MSDLEALELFVRKPVSQSMINFLVNTTNSVIQVAPQTPVYEGDFESRMGDGYLTPPDSPTLSHKIPTLHSFIRQLVKYSHVPTSTLMSALIYLTRLREVLPPNSVGMETTRHRIFLGALILAAKTLNDSSPLNKHWCKYTDGLLTLQDVNALEIEMIDYLGWGNLLISTEDLIRNFSHFLEPIKWKLRHRHELKISKARAQYLKPCRKMSLGAPLSPNSPTQPLYSHSGVRPPQKRYNSYLPSPTSSSAPSSADSSVMSVPSLVSSSSASSNTLSSLMTENGERVPRPRMTTLDGGVSLSLKPLRLSGYNNNSKPEKENSGYRLSHMNHQVYA